MPFKIEFTLLPWDELLLRSSCRLIFRKKASIILGAILFLTEHFSRYGFYMPMMDRYWVIFSRQVFNLRWHLSSYVIFKARSWKEFIMFIMLLRNIQTKGEYPNWDAKNAFVTVFFFLGTWLELFLLMHCGFGMLFYWSYLCDLQNSFESKLYLIVILVFWGDGIIININTYNVLSWEKYMTFVTIDFHVVKVKPLKKKFGKVLQ